MTPFPVIVGFGGVGAAGRSSFHHAYRRTIFESLDAADRDRTLRSLAALTGTDPGPNGIAPETAQKLLDGTLVRRIEPSLFDPDRVHGHAALTLSNGGTTELHVLRRDLPDPLPQEWCVTPTDDASVRLQLPSGTAAKLDVYRRLTVQAGGQLPSGFKPAALYNSRFHPRGLQLTIIAASDAVRSMGIDWETVRDAVRPDEICVYAASAMGQLDGFGTSGMTQARLLGNRVSSKQLPLGLNQMPADFVNAYVLGSVGATGAAVGACATFLYNLRTAIEDIQSGRRRVAVVGNAEAPLVPEVIEGYAAMSALATDEALCRLDRSAQPDHRRASRPFGDNCGFVLGESGQYVVLFDDALALELGAQIHGAVPGVFVNADGYKKSISAPGPGNYITLAKAAALAGAIVGDDGLRRRSFVQAHGSSTPQNRVTESRIFDQVAAAFGIESWPVTAVKAFVGHSLAPASADQMMSSLGILRHGTMPGIKTITGVAADVLADRLNIAVSDYQFPEAPECAFLNSKGFGGNNATGVVLSPAVAERMLARRHGADAMKSAARRRESALARAEAYDAECSCGPMQPIYRFGDALMDEGGIRIDADGLHLPGFRQPVNLDLVSPFGDMQ